MIKSLNCFFLPNYHYKVELVTSRIFSPETGSIKM